MSPGAVCRKGVDDVVANAGNLIRFNAEAHEKGNLSGFSSSERFQLYALIAFRLTYHREVDRRRYRDARRVLVLLSETGQPVPLDETLAGSLIKASEMPDRT